MCGYNRRRTLQLAGLFEAGLPDRTALKERGRNETVGRAVSRGESGRFQARVQMQLPQDVLDVRSCCLGANREHASDAEVVSALYDEGQDLSLTPRELGQLADGLVLIPPSLDQSSQQRSEHPGRDQGLAAGHCPGGVDQLIEA